VEKDGKTAVMYGPLSLVNNRCGSSMTFGSTFENCSIHSKDHHLYTVLKLKTTSLRNIGKAPIVYPNTEVVIKYNDGKSKKYTCNCLEHQAQRSRKRSRE
jgi:hypothetical protein